jgi:hypothetical protein
MKRTLIVAAMLLVAAVAGAQDQMFISHEPITCINAGEMPALQMQIQGEGEVRAYFRRINTTDWCSVEGTNDGPLSRVALPKFEAGDEIEYFFVLLEKRRVLARSARIYRAKVTESCESPFVRYALKISMDCGENTAGSIPSAMRAGYSIRNEQIDGEPPYGCPDRPNPAGAPWIQKNPQQ